MVSCFVVSKIAAIHRKEELASIFQAVFGELDIPWLIFAFSQQAACIVLMSLFEIKHISD